MLRGKELGENIALIVCAIDPFERLLIEPVDFLESRLIATSVLCCTCVQIAQSSPGLQ